MFKKISLIIPVYNEEGNLFPLYNDIKKLPSSLELEIIFIDDGSKDGSLKDLIKMQSTDERIKIISFNKNYGQTAAMGAGVKYATGEVIIPLDADGQNDPADIPKLLEKLEEGCGVVSGWRKRRHDEFKRVFLSQLANKLISFITKVKIHDYGCSLKAYRAEIIKNIDFYGEVHRLLPAYASWRGDKVAEVVVNHRPRTIGVSKYGFNRIFKILMDLLVAKFIIGYSAKPIYFFGTGGLVLFLFGILSFVVAVVFRILGTSFIQTPLLLLTVMMFVLGIQIISIGLIADLILRSNHGKDHSIYTVKELIGF